MNAIHRRATFEDGTSAADRRIDSLAVIDAQNLFRSGFTALLDEIDTKTVILLMYVCT